MRTSRPRSSSPAVARSEILVLQKTATGCSCSEASDGRSATTDGICRVFRAGLRQPRAGHDASGLTPSSVGVTGGTSRHQHSGDIPERNQVQSGAARELLFLPFAQAELDVGIGRRHPERAEQQVPHRKHECKILVDVCRMVAVMNLMVGGTAKEIHERTRPFEPDVRVSKVVSQTVVGKNEYPHPEYGWLRRHVSKQR